MSRDKDIPSLGHIEIERFLREVRFCSHSPVRDSSSSIPLIERYVNFGRVEKEEEEEGAIWLCGTGVVFMMDIEDIFGQSEISN